MIVPQAIDFLPAADAHRDRFELRFARRSHSPAPEATLIDEDELRAMLQVLPDLKASAIADPDLSLLENLIWLTKSDENPSALGEPSRPSLIAKTLVRRDEATEIITQTLMFRRLRIWIGLSPERHPG